VRPVAPGPPRRPSAKKIQPAGPEPAWNKKEDTQGGVTGPGGEHRSQRHGPPQLHFRRMSGAARPHGPARAMDGGGLPPRGWSPPPPPGPACQTKPRAT
jgi:hypothetical protein